ncbi:hypothetical protein FOA52_012640 [Chlamydomonas sp. UWO 241]|nr:hypothetical protein FOA52_012640 [Chlamydomonas sp. UWO 241]
MLESVHKVARLFRDLVIIPKRKGVLLFNKVDVDGLTVEDNEMFRQWLSSADKDKIPVKLWSAAVELRGRLDVWLRTWFDWTGQVTAEAGWAFIWNMIPAGRRAKAQPTHADRPGHRTGAPYVMLLALRDFYINVVPFSHSAVHELVVQTLVLGKEAADIAVADGMQVMASQRVHVPGGHVIIMDPATLHYGDEGTACEEWDRFFVPFDFIGETYVLEPGEAGGTWPLARLSQHLCTTTLRRIMRSPIIMSMLCNLPLCLERLNVQ